MKRGTKAVRTAALPAILALVMMGLDSSSAGADPGPDPAPACSYVLTPPSRVTIAGTDMVTATLTPGPCTGLIQPNSFTVCVALRGYTPPQCKFSPVYGAVQVYFTPYRSGATYTATGNGCGNVFPNADQVCTPVGPATRTL